MSEDTEAVRIAEVVRDLIGCLCNIVQLPREQKKEWIKTLDKIIYSSEEELCRCVNCPWTGMANPIELCPDCLDCLEIK